jgi:hypothetical protein
MESKKIWIKACALLILVFALGCVTGVALTGLVRIRTQATASPTIREPEAYFETLRRELSLTPDQSSSIKAILEDTRGEYRKVCSEVRPRYDVLREQARTRMRALLDATQQERFDSIVLKEDCSTCPDRRQ